MNKKYTQLNEYEVENVSEQLARFFYSFWKNQNNNKVVLNNEITVLSSGSLEGYPDKLKQ